MDQQETLEEEREQSLLSIGTIPYYIAKQLDNSRPVSEHVDGVSFGDGYVTVDLITATGALYTLTYHLTEVVRVHGNQETTLYENTARKEA